MQKAGGDTGHMQETKPDLKKVCQQVFGPIIIQDQDLPVRSRPRVRSIPLV